MKSEILKNNKKIISIVLAYIIIGIIQYFKIRSNLMLRGPVYGPGPMVKGTMLKGAESGVYFASHFASEIAFHTREMLINAIQNPPLLSILALFLVLFIILSGVDGSLKENMNVKKILKVLGFFIVVSTLANLSLPIFTFEFIGPIPLMIILLIMLILIGSYFQKME